MREEPAVAEGRLPSPAHGFSFYPGLFITTPSSVCVNVTSQSLESALCWCPFLPVHPSAFISLCYEFQMLLFNVALEEKGGKERKSLIMCSSGGLGKGVQRGGVLGFRLRIKFIDVWGSGQHRPELQPPTHVQEELTLLVPRGKSPLPPACLPSLGSSLPPAHPDVIKEFSSCLFALGCSCSPCFTPQCVHAHARMRLCTHPRKVPRAVAICISF